MPFTCKFCEKVFSNKSNHKRHINEVHKQTAEPLSYGKDSVWSSCCLEPNCNKTFSNNRNLMQHLHNDHSMNFEMESHVFQNTNDFENWKSGMEKTNGCYVLKRKYSSTVGEVMYYKCNRSKNSYKIKGIDERKRLLKSQGSCKMNNSCTSEIKVTNEGNKIVVDWQKIHYGHDFEIQHVRIPNVERQSIVNKMVNGVANQRILETTRDQIGEHLKRIDLLTSRDLRNISNSCSLEWRNGKRDPNDAFSVALWVEECKELKENPILFCKFQGTEHNILRDGDFCIIIMNTFQKQMIQKFPHIITIDSTHGLNGYDFEMTTIMVIDEFHHGFPVAEMFTNRKDTLVHRLFFTVVREEVGFVYCKFFMSDMAECFFNAWLEAMGEQNVPYPQHLFCSWHVDRAWQSNLTKISDKGKRTEIYKILKILQQETPLTQFTSAMTNALAYMCNNENTRSFGEYFKNTYSHNFKKWAYCYRAEAGINTNMHLESMHKVIKYFYLERKTVKRLDKGLNAVLKYVRDKSVERIIRLSKGEHTKQTKLMSQNHMEALKHTDDYIITTNSYNGSWNVSKNQQTYNILRLLDMKCCQQICSFCDVCAHMFSCECKFYLEKRTICKHIHLVLMQIPKQVKPAVNSIAENISDELLALTDKKLKSTNKKICDIKDLALRFESLDFEHFNDEIINKIHYHLMIARNLTHCSEFSNNKFQSTNASKKRLIEPQMRFTSTKKKYVKSKTDLKRATIQEAINIEENLSHACEDSFLHISAEPLNDHQYC